MQLQSLCYVKGARDLLNLGYEYGSAPAATDNNGQIRKVRSYTSPGVEDPTKTQSYEYDAWSHLKRAYTTDLTQPGTWRLEWGYDRLGNRRNQSLTGGNTAITQPQLTISETTNRITTAGYAHDAAGNMTNDSLHSYTYDAEGRMTKVDSGTTASYSYVGASRVKKVSGSTTTVYIYSGSKVIAEYVNGALSKEYVYAGGTLLATLNPDGSVASYKHPDHLSTRVETDAAGVVTRTFGQYPFGEVWYETGTASKWKFTSYERDSESGLDQAVFRYDSARLGRFMSPDPLAGSLGNPQSLNRYAYVGNDPVNFTDPLGLIRPACIRGDEAECGESGGGGGSAGDEGLDPFWACGWLGLCGGTLHPPLLPPDDPGKHQGQVNKVLQRIKNNIDPKCLDFLTNGSPKLGTHGNSEGLQAAGGFSGLIDEITTNNRFGVADLSQIDPRYDENTAAATSLVAGQFDTVNSKGAFFNENSSGGGQFLVDFGKYRGGQIGAQAFILLHELGHLTGGLIPDTTGDQKKDRKAHKKNDKALDKNCNDTLKAITK